MSAIDNWKQLKRDKERLERWYSLYLKEYHGGGGGVGNLVRSPIEPVIYYQEYNGATNYHEAPKEVLGFLEYGAKACFTAIYKKALERATFMVEEAAVAARKEVLEIMSTTEGLTTNENDKLHESVQS